MSERLSSPKCPNCGFTVFTNRYPKCEKCGLPLPAGMVLSKEELNQVLSREREEQEALDRQKREREARSGSGFDSSDLLLDLGDLSGGDV